MKPGSVVATVAALANDQNEQYSFPADLISRLTVDHIASVQTPATNAFNRPNPKTLHLTRHVALPSTSFDLPHPQHPPGSTFSSSPLSLGHQSCRDDALPRDSAAAIPIRRRQEKMFQCFSFRFLFPARPSPETLIYSPTKQQFFHSHTSSSIVQSSPPSPTLQRCISQRKLDRLKLF